MWKISRGLPPVNDKDGFLKKAALDWMRVFTKAQLPHCMKHNLRRGLALLALSALTQTQAQFVPVPLTAESFNHDIVVEKEAPHPFTPVTTASMDGGTNNGGATFYEVGYNLDALETGLPIAGSTFFSQDLPDHSFELAANYKASNALLIDQAHTNGTFTLGTPAAYSSLSFLTAAANGPVGLNYTLTFEDGHTETGTFSAQDWYNGTNVAVNLNGRVVATSGLFESVNTSNPRVYSADVAVVNSSERITKIELSFGTGGANGRAAILAVSGSTGAEFTPIRVTGYNQDIIVEADAGRAGPLEVTDASLDGGTSNTAYTAYEQGYNLTAPATGLPQAGTTLTNATAADHVYRMPASYSGANVALVDSAVPTATLTFATPANQSAISLLGTAGGGAVTLNYTINHADSSVQTGSIVIPDWFNVTPFAFPLRGRVHVGNGSFNAVDTENPRLYSVDIAVERTSSPITSVQLDYASGNGHAAIFAVSGTAGAVRPIFDVQPWSTNAFVATTAELIATVSGTAPITLQWQREVNGAYVNVTNGGAVSGANTGTLSFSNLGLNDAGNFILVASNAAGSSTSLVTRLNVYSDKPDITSPSDEATMVGGTAPANEPAANAIDDTTSKYLNFGTDGNTTAGFTGPVGLVVTPVAGSTVVTGLRVYTANDAVDRDPIDYTLEGSNNGGESFTTISSGALALPAGRNAAALELSPLTQPNYEVNFANAAGYTTYRLTFTNVKNNTAANSMQIGEIELLGTPGTGTPQGPTLQIARSGTGVTISWEEPGTLQATPTLNNPDWTTVTSDSPATLETTGDHRFFRVVR